MADTTIEPLAPGEHAALFFDIDGTLVWSERPKDGGMAPEPVPSPATYEAFKTLRERGHAAFICTGRPLCIIGEELHKLELAGMVSGAGACVTVGGERIYDDVLDRDLVLQSIEIFERCGVDVMLEGTDGSVELQPRQDDGFLWYTLGVPGARDRDGVLAIRPELRFMKYCFRGGEIERLGDELAFFQQHFVVCDLGNGSFEMTMRGVDKALGIKRAVAALGEGPWRTYGFGDSENDLPMLHGVDVPVAMGNSLPSVIEASAYVSCHAKDDGVVHALEHLGLI